MNSLGLIVKPTRQCNLRCTYCHDWRARSPRMSFEILAKLVFEALTPRYHERVDFIWHGGEPLLLGRRFFEQAILVQTEFLRDDQRVLNNIQTNGTLIDKAWCNFFKTHGFQVGVSIDGPPEVHDVSRRYASNKSSYDDVRRGIGYLIEEGVQFGALMVLSRQAVELGAEAVVKSIMDLGVESFSFLPARPDNVVGSNQSIRSEYITGEEYSDFMIDVFDLWFRWDNPKIRIRELSSLVGTLVGKHPAVCTLAGACIGQYYHVEPNGDLFHCDKYLGDPDYAVGNIGSNTFSEIRAGAAIKRLQSNEIAALQKLDCPHVGVCNGGCPHDRYVASNYLTTWDGRCCGQKKLIEHIATRLEEVAARIDPALGAELIAPAFG